ncbi:DUF637 domain-containing protein [Moraxella catarrhalis]|uniref:DUF637 domain-containing protein n=1 Tax=Moraxella catarrhalis TaxID=480 RepID=UPI000202AEFB|nr:DUF637 domain-containing protein [Moraxella catarrhalis]EGE18383.1 putative MafB-like protein [Moraxella catarrhalis BC1]
MSSKPVCTTQPQYSYLNDLVNRNDVDWQQIILTDKDWDYKQQGLTPAGAAIVAIAVAYATGGVGTALTSTVATATGSTTLGTMTSAAFSSLVTQASISLIDNQGNIKQTLKDLGSKQNIKQMTFAIASAGIGSKINKSLGLSNTDITQAGFNDRLIKGIADGTSRGLLESAVYGVDLEEALKQSLTKELVGLGTQNIFKDIIHDIDGDTLARNIAHKLAAGLTGCLSAQATDNACEAGSIGAVVGEMWGDYQVDDPNTLTQAQKDKLINQAKLIAGITAVFAGEDVNVAANVAAEAVENNAVETVWDIANIGVGAASFGYNISEGNYGSATIDGVGLIYDGIATALPFLPAGASAVIKVERATETTKNVIKAENFFDGAKYTQKVKIQASSGDYHSFPQSVDGFAKHGTVSKITGKDGVVRDKLEIPGSYRGKKGIFEYSREPNGNINHRLFVPNEN